VAAEKKFTRKEGKPFAVVWSKIEPALWKFVVWNEVYIAVSESWRRAESWKFAARSTLAPIHCERRRQK